MTLPVSGAISFNAINVELGVAGTTTADINQASYRTLAGVPSGQISLSNFYGKSNRVVSNITIATSTANYVLNTAKVAGYVAGKTDVTLTINSGIVVYSASTGSYALTVDTSWAAGDTVTIVNNGVILGKGGAGGNGYFDGVSAPQSGSAGGPALLVQRATSINNVNRISGGGGGGGGNTGATPSGKTTLIQNGGGGGGGIGNGAGGLGGNTYSTPATNGSAGTLTAAGSGGASAGSTPGAGGNGGTYATSGSSGSGGYNANGSGGAGGACLSGNSYITWIALGTRNGTIT